MFAFNVRVALAAAEFHVQKYMCAGASRDLELVTKFDGLGVVRDPTIKQPTFAEPCEHGFVKAQVLSSKHSFKHALVERLQQGGDMAMWIRSWVPSHDLAGKLLLQSLPYGVETVT